MKKKILIIISANISIIICLCMLYTFAAGPPDDMNYYIIYFLSAAGFCILMIPFVGYSFYRFLRFLITHKTSDILENTKITFHSKMLSSELLCFFSKNGSFSQDEKEKLKEFLKEIDLDTDEDKK